jgi:hypothetical protein
LKKELFRREDQEELHDTQTADILMLE